MHLLSLLSPKWTSIFVGDIDISFDNNRTLRVAANFDDTRFTWSWHSDGSYIGLNKVFGFGEERQRPLKFESQAGFVMLKTMVLKYVLTNRVRDTLDSLCFAMSL